MVCVDSAGQMANGDSVLLFPRAFRQPGLSYSPAITCADTFAAFWLGRKCVRRPDGTDLYSNGAEDTVFIRTRAQLGESWILSKDANGHIFHATVTSLDTTTIDGSLDSVKTASIQAYAAGQPVLNHYNSTRLRWSKQKGWVAALDLYTFPNRAPSGQEYFVGIRADSVPAVRMPIAVIKDGLVRVDLSWRYAPGNEWIYLYKVGTVPGLGPSGGAYTYDSVMSVHWLSTTAIGVTYKRATYSFQYNQGGWGYTNGNLQTSVRTDTVTDALSTGQMPIPILPDHHPRNLAFNQSSSGFPVDKDEVYGVDSVCGGSRYTIHYSLYDFGWSFLNGCWTMSQGFRSSNTSVMSGFGMVASCSTAMHNGVPYLTSSTGLVYADLNGCQLGTKINVAALAVDNAPAIGQGAATISPNPASATATVSNLPAGEKQLSLLDVTGRALFRTSTKDSSHSIRTDGLPPSLYLVEISGPTGRTTLKLQVVH